MSQDQKPKGVRVVNGSTTPMTGPMTGLMTARGGEPPAKGAAKADAGTAAPTTARGNGMAMLGGLFLAASAFGGAAIALLIHT
jgi:hypothetical protein